MLVSAVKIALISWWVYGVVGRSVPKSPGPLCSPSPPLISDTVYTVCGATPWDTTNPQH